MMEGVSFLLLLGVAMPLKYLTGEPLMVRIVGSAHGLLFLMFVAAVFEAGFKLRWPLRLIAFALVSSVLPFGPFVFDAHLRRTTTAAAPPVAA